MNNKQAIKRFSSLYRDFIAEHEKCSSPNTVATHLTTMKQYLSFLKTVIGRSISNISINDFEASYIERYLDCIKQNGVVAATCNIRLSSLRSFLKYAAQHNPEYLWLYTQCQHIKKRIDIERPRVDPLSKKALGLILKEPDKNSRVGLKYLTIMIFLYTTATRINEVLSLKMKDLKLDIDCPDALVMGKGRRTRMVFIHDKLMKYLRAYINEYHGKTLDPEAYLFFSTSKGRYNKLSREGVNKQLKVYAKNAAKKSDEIPLNLHSHQFRHSSATHALENKMSVFQISKMLGHQSVNTTMTYLGFTPKLREEAVKKLEIEEITDIRPIWKGRTTSLEALFGLK